MDQNFTIKLNANNCSSCYCEDRFLHHLWNGQRSQKMCTSCILFEHHKSFCPTCFDLIVDPGSETLISCSECSSYSHARCVSVSDMPFKCSTCVDPERLIFDLQELRVSERQENEGCCKLMDLKAARLLLTASKIVQTLISEAYDKSVSSAVIQATKAVSARIKAIGSVDRFVKYDESQDRPSLLDGPETSSETQRAPN